MTDYAGDLASSSTGTVANERTGAASGDTVPAGAVVLWRNTGAGAHTVTLTNNATQDGLAVANRTIPLAAGQNKVNRINPAWGDANGRVGVAIDTTATEIKYTVLGGV